MSRKGSASALLLTRILACFVVKKAIGCGRRPHQTNLRGSTELSSKANAYTIELSLDNEPLRGLFLLPICHRWIQMHTARPSAGTKRNTRKEQNKQIDFFRDFRDFRSCLRMQSRYYLEKYFRCWQLVIQMLSPELSLHILEFLISFRQIVIGSC